MVKPGDTVSFKVSRAYTLSGTTPTTTLRATDENYTGEFKAKLVWADADVIITDEFDELDDVTGSGNTAVVSVQTKSTAGNAVVKIYKKDDSSETPVWSYHIWVTGYDGSDTFTNTNGNGKSFVFMDRNLGATFAGTGSGAGTGLFYQWGRKDPFPATGSVTAATTNSTNGTVVNTIQHPDVFLTAGSESSYDWHYAKRDNTLWGHSALKTIYDPCPAGWRVPVNSGSSTNTSPWYGFGDSSNNPANLVEGSSFSTGYNWGDNALYPAAGNRHNGMGVLNLTGMYGLYWSASPNSNNALIMDFSSSKVYVSSGNYRAYGYSVRCVKE
jgi:uncharacterized protein (TIGR02145 family)